MAKSQNMTPNKKELQLQAQNSWREVKTKNKNIIQDLIFNLLNTPIQHPPFSYFSQKTTLVELPTPPPVILPELPDNDQLPINATAQRQSVTILNKAKAELYEYTNLLKTATSSTLRTQFTSKIEDLEKTIEIEERKLKRLKDNAAARKRARNKKQQKLEEENIVEIYDTPGRPSFLINDSNFLDKMHKSIEFGAADYKRRKEVIKVRTVKHLREKMEENYSIHIARSTLQNYMQPRHPGSKEANRHHHPAQIRLAAVGRNEMNEHVDEHYCLASVKGAKSFVSAFPQDTVLISQDDKAKVLFGKFFFKVYILTFMLL
jgi:hypothetical protein